MIQVQSTKHKSIVKNQKGQGLVEYLIIVSLVAVATISVMRVVGQSVQVKFAKVAESLGATVDGKEIGDAKIVESNWKKKDMSDFMNNSK